MKLKARKSIILKENVKRMHITLEKHFIEQSNLFFVSFVVKPLGNKPKKTSSVRPSSVSSSVTWNIFDLALILSLPIDS